MKDGFAYIHSVLNSVASAHDVDVPDIDPMLLGKFDLALLLFSCLASFFMKRNLMQPGGCSRHVRRPYRHRDRDSNGTPVRACLDQTSVQTNPPTSVHQTSVLEVMLGSLGFSRIEATLSPVFRQA